ncbi:MAG: M14 family metallocarboxypeptidase [Burkholderiales bacterium]|nr:M14 family metallocarboxypeptidase [Burkholderiales bacterium]MBS0404470.1 M14 family metallocarboxypeptidase [Pseudomonadota bacterium]MBS0414879.1 M14 family metallocarboxypeptidase [Pseudomonadota bacterium]HMN56243.1 M14 family metallocarboxypeptidase [Ottowia sp.]
MRAVRCARFAAVALLLAASGAWAQFDPARVHPEPPPVHARFAAPAMQFQTPAFDPWQIDFTSHAQMMARLQALVGRPSVHLEIVGESGQGRALPLVLLARGGRWQADKPTLMLVAHQHGNEPAPGEAILVLLERWSAPAYADLLRRVNVVVLPRANPDGAALFKRATAVGDIDMNRDHLLLRTPEARAVARVAARYRPQVVLDMHEFTAGERWVTRFGAWTKYDVLLQAATTGNLDAGVYQAGMDDFLPAIRRAVQAEGLSDFWYHTTTARPDAPVAMGGVQPDTWRNIGGLRNAVSILHETRGYGIGKQNLARRVQSHVVAAQALLEQVAQEGPALLEQARRADRAVAGQACKGQVVVAAQQTPEKRELTLIDAQTGEDRAVPVDWRSALKLQVTRQRPRPCGYWLAASEGAAVRTLRLLGVQVKPLASARSIRVERYDFKSIEAGQRQDGRGAIQDQGGIVKTQVDVQPLRRHLPAGGWYVSLAQPLAGLVTAALEPDSQSSYVAARLIAVPRPGEPDRLLRVMEPMGR